MLNGLTFRQPWRVAEFPESCRDDVKILDFVRRRSVQIGDLNGFQHWNLKQYRPGQIRGCSKVAAAFNRRVPPLILHRSRINVRIN
jgi:hypothetical protein